MDLTDMGDHKAVGPALLEIVDAENPPLRAAGRSTHTGRLAARPGNPRDSLETCPNSTPQHAR
ncbi:hypothetical protein [Streptomyces sp. 2A115]|uniref:hypothetical protein n=1 Tax=Streptomyces sp. 2A115 TaxID=3457439 RepID=UPI003FD44180